MLPTPVFLPEKSHGKRSLVGYSPWGCKESDLTEQLTLLLFKQSSTLTVLISSSLPCKLPQWGSPWASLMAQQVKNLLARQETQETRVRSLGQKDPLEEGMATHSSILAWRIPWTESLVSCRPQCHKELDTTE